MAETKELTTSFVDFFKSECSGVEVQERKISKRFPAFKAAPLSASEVAQIRKAATQQKRVGKRFLQETNAEAVLTGMILTSVVYPDFNNAELQKSWGVLGAESLLKTMLLAGEYDDLAAWISEISGYDASESDLEEDIETAKNS